jgi:hypothetical protein
MSLANVEITALIDEFLREAKAAARSLAAKLELPIECDHVEAALVEVFALDDSTELLDLGLSRDKILSAVDSYDFRRFFPQPLATLAVEDSIIPRGGIRRLVEQTVRVHGEVWRVHRNDADPFPSNPHAHNLESGLKLHLGTGELFLGKQFAGTINRKDLLAIRNALVDFALPTLCC